MSIKIFVITQERLAGGGVSNSSKGFTKYHNAIAYSTKFLAKRKPNSTRKIQIYQVYHVKTQTRGKIKKAADCAEQKS